MTTCSHCHRPADDGARFCEACGAALLPRDVCPRCGAPTQAEFLFCCDCGAPLQQEQTVCASTAQAAPLSPDAPCTASPASRRHPWKLWGGIGGGFVALFLIGVLLLELLLNVQKVNPTILYVKDRQLYGATVSGTPWQVSTDFLATDLVTDWHLAQMGSTLSQLVYISPDGERLFFMDEIGANGSKLFYCDIYTLGRKTVEIGLAQDYVVNREGTCVVYQNGAVLCRYDLRKQEILSKKVSRFMVSEDGERVAYITTDKELYIKEAGKEVEKLDDGVDGFYHVGRQLEWIHYLKDSMLYVWEDGKQGKALVDSRNNVWKTYPSGEMYYSKKDGNTLMDYIVDDMKEVDEAMVPPTAPDYPSLNDYANYTDFCDAVSEYNTLCARYEAEQEVYQQKEERDELRRILSEEAVKERADLYYYDGEKEVLVAKNMDVSRRIFANDRPAMLTQIIQSATTKEWTLSEIQVQLFYDRVSTAYAAQRVAEWVTQDTQKQTKQALVIGDKALDWGEPDALNLVFSQDGRTLYYVKPGVASGMYGDLYKCTRSDTGWSEPQLCDTKVQSSSVSITEGGKLCYGKNTEDGSREWIIGGVVMGKSDSAMYTLPTVYVEDEERFFFYGDWDKDTTCGTLMVYEDGEVTRVEKEVKAFVLLPNGDLAYMTNFDTNTLKGDLWCYQDGDCVLVDEGVITLIPFEKADRWSYIY